MTDQDELKASIDERFGPGLGEKIAEALGGIANAGVVYGAPIERDGVTVIPVASVKTRFGFGFGKGHDKDERGGGGGGGVSAVPAGYIEIAGGETRFKRIGPPAAVGIMAAIGGTIVLSLTVIGAAWGKLGKK